MCLFDRFVLLSLLCQLNLLCLDYLVVPFVQWCRFARYYQLDQLLPMGLGIRLRPLCRLRQLYRLYRLCLDYLLRRLRRLCRWCPLYQLSLEDPLRQFARLGL